MFWRSILLLPTLVSASNWNWEQIDLERVDFPETFLWGTASSEYQISGAEKLPNCQWAEWEKKGDPAIKGGQTSGSAIEGWDRYKEDIALLKEMGLNSYRFSVDWSAIEPEEGYFDKEAIEHYLDVCKELKKNNIEPMITLHHFTHPIWFEEKGAFEKRENIDYFVRFAKFVFTELSNDVSLWCTMNEPTVIALMGYILGEFPPGKRGIFLAAEVLNNMLFAHVAVYKELKQMKNGDTSQIGIVHSYLKFEPYSGWNPIEAMPCLFFTKNLHQTVMDFFKTGEFSSMFFQRESVPEAKESFDFFGLNYYSRPVIGMKFSLKEFLGPTCFPGEVMTDMPYPSYAEGFYDALIDCGALGKPVYVTENGIADEKDDRRELFIKKYLYALSRAISDGVDVRGYFYWSLIDNFEWAEGWSMKFGLYECDLESKERVLRDGSKAYIEAVNRHNQSQELLEGLISC
jgi:beta-glucosidase